MGSLLPGTGGLVFGIKLVYSVSALYPMPLVSGR